MHTRRHAGQNVSAGEAGARGAATWRRNGTTNQSLAMTDKSKTESGEEVQRGGARDEK